MFYQNPALSQQPETNHFIFDINQAKKQIYRASSAVEIAIKKFLQESPPSSQKKHEIVQELMQSALSLQYTLNDQNACSALDKQKAYLHFVTTLLELSQDSKEFAALLTEKNTLDLVCDSIGKIIYNRSKLAAQIKPNMEAHVDFMKAAWLSGQPQLQNTIKPKR